MSMISSEDDPLQSQIQSYIRDINDLRAIQEEIFNNPEVAQIFKDEELKEKTSLSPFTLIENSVVSLTTDQLRESGHGLGSNKQLLVNEMLEKANLKLKMAEFKLNRLVDTGEFHV